MKKSSLERKFEYLAKLFKLPEYVEQYKFAPKRKFRFDIAYPAPILVAIELDGGIYSGGRHTRGVGYENDCVKGNLAIELGWVVLHYTPNHLKKDPGGVIVQILRVLKQRKEIGESEYPDEA